MGESPGMVGLIGTIHHLLKIIQQPGGTKTLRLRDGLRQQPQRWQRRALRGSAEPLTQLCTGIFEETLELRIQRFG